MVRRDGLCKGPEDSWYVGGIAGGSVSRASEQGEGEDIIGGILAICKDFGYHDKLKREVIVGFWT